jgi:NADH-quinone oxidoreductase subunit N
MSPVLIPAVGALLVLALDVLARAPDPDQPESRRTALSGIRLGSVALLSLLAVAIVLRFGDRDFEGPLLALDAFGVFGIGFVVVAGTLVLSLSLTHFGMARSRPAEPIALLLFAWAGSMTAMVTDHLLVLLIAIELAWLPMVALIAIDSRRLSSSESSLKAFFAHAFASLIFAHGVALVFGVTGRLDVGALAGTGVEDNLLFQVGLTLVLVGLLARAAVAPFHPWSPDVHEGAPSFVTTHIATVAQATSFFVLLRLLHSVPPDDPFSLSTLGPRVSELLSWLGLIALLWGHAMALVQVGLRRLVGWLGVGQAGFFTYALIDAQAGGGEALLLAVVAAGVSIAGVMATLSSLSHHERACEQMGDLGGMMARSPVRAALLGLFLLSLGGFPGTIGFVARFEILAALEHAGHRPQLVIGLGATALALTAVGRPLLAMVRPAEAGREGSRALSNEQFVLAICGVIVLYFGLMPVIGETNLAGQLDIWIDRAIASLRA